MFISGRAMASHSRNKPRWPVLLFLLGVSAGVLGEGLLFMQAQARRIERRLLDDFRVLAFLGSSADESRESVTAERLRALPGVESVRYLSPQRSLDELAQRDPELVQSVALLGANPLTGAFEIELSGWQVAALPQWVEAASTVSEIEDFRWSPVAARAILQVQFYARLVTLVLSLALFCWLIASAWLLWVKAGAEGWAPEWGFSRAAASRVAASGGGTLLGMALVVALAYPIPDAGELRTWPSLLAQLALLLAGMLGGWVWSGLALPVGRGAALGAAEARRRQEEKPTGEMVQCSAS